MVYAVNFNGSFFGVAVCAVWSGGDKVQSDKAAGPAGDTGSGKVQTTRGD